MSDTLILVSIAEVLARMRLPNDDISSILVSRDGDLLGNEPDPAYRDSWRCISVETDDPDQVRVFVTVYNTSKEYGGPEEGGWWWCMRSIERTLPTTLKYAKELKKRLEAGECSNEGRRELSSVLSDGRYDVCVEMCPGESEKLSSGGYC